MADHVEIMRRLHRHEGVNYPVLTPNLQGFQAAVEAGVREVAVFAAASEGFSIDRHDARHGLEHGQDGRGRAHADGVANRLAGHYHDTFGMAIANVSKSYEFGLRVFDSSVAGLGGCTYAKGVATEDVVLEQVARSSPSARRRRAPWDLSSLAGR